MSGYQAKTSKDADLEIVLQGIMAHGDRDTIIFGDGTDLLVLFIHYWKEWGPSENNLYMFRPLSETQYTYKNGSKCLPKVHIIQHPDDSFPLWM